MGKYSLNPISLISDVDFVLCRQIIDRVIVFRIGRHRRLGSGTPYAISEYPVLSPNSPNSTHDTMESDQDRTPFTVIVIQNHVFHYIFMILRAKNKKNLSRYYLAERQQPFNNFALDLAMFQK